jgi:hypothetical protein
MSDEKAEAVATYTARGREDAPAARRHASLIAFVEINCFRPGDPRHCASQGVQLPVATAHTSNLTSAALRGLHDDLNLFDAMPGAEVRCKCPLKSTGRPSLPVSFQPGPASPGRRVDRPRPPVQDIA